MMLISSILIYEYLMLCYALKVRPAESVDGKKTDGKENEHVELEKSNILLMGPTGSGNLLNDWVHF